MLPRYDACSRQGLSRGAFKATVGEGNRAGDAADGPDVIVYRSVGGHSAVVPWHWADRAEHRKYGRAVQLS